MLLAVVDLNFVEVVVVEERKKDPAVDDGEGQC